MSFLSDETRAALARLVALDDAADPSDAPAPAASGLTRLSAVRSLLSALDADPASLASVRAAQGAGASWDEIGAAAGLSPAAAKARWSGTDAEMAARQQASRKRSARPSAKPTDLPGMSVAEAAEKLGVSVQAIYLRVTRGQLKSHTIELADGRKYKRILMGEEPSSSVPVLGVAGEQPS